MVGVVVISMKTSSAGAEISDGPHKGGLRRAGPNDFMFVYHLIQRNLYMSILFICLSSFLFLFLQLEYNSQSCNLHLVDGTVYYS